MKIISVPIGTKIAVCGDIHEHHEQFNKLLELIQPSEKIFFVSVGDVCDKGFGVSSAEMITDKLIDLNQKGCGFIVRGNHELKTIKKAIANNLLTPQLDWLSRQPLTLSFQFYNGTRITILHGGIKPAHTIDDLNQDIEVCYIRKLDENGEPIKLHWVGNLVEPTKAGGVSWHEVYDGRFGYIAAGHEPLKDGKPRFYNYSCNIDTAVYDTGILTCQIFSDLGKDQLISVAGTPRRWVP